MKFLQNQHLELQLSGSPFKGKDAGKPGDSKALAFGVSMGHEGSGLVLGWPRHVVLSMKGEV